MQWVKSEQLKDNRTIVIGYNPFTLQPAKIIDYYLGDAFLFAGMTGYGKSILAGNVAVELSRTRNLIIFDYKGDYRNLKHINFENKDRMFNCIPDLVYIHRFGFKLQDFTNPFDWEMMGMTANGANICASKAKMTLYHKNDMNRFRELIEEVTVFGKSDKAEVWRATKQSILSKLNGLRHCFVGNDAIDITHRNVDEIRYHGIPFYISDWRYFCRKHKHICLNLNSEFSPQKAQLFAGKIMNELEPIMQEIRPVFLMEEAHKLCPEAIDDANVPYSMVKILHYLKELHKKGVKLILISQYPHQLQDEVLDEVKRFFIGKLQNVKGHSKLDDIFRLSSALTYNFMTNYREFWHFAPLYNEKDLFVPYDSYTYYERRK